MNEICPIYGNKKIINTRDGSYTFYSMEYNESYKTKSVGAFTESMHKFVYGTDLINRAKEKDIRILDICFGVGMNISASFDMAIKNNISNKIHIVSVEKDYSLINLVKNLDFLFPSIGYKKVQHELTKIYSSYGNIYSNHKDFNIQKHNSIIENKDFYRNLSMELYIQDAVEFIYSLNSTFDVIYFDPFSKKHNIEMWSDNMFIKLYSLLNSGGVLTTYGASKSIKESLSNAGFQVSSLSSIGYRHQPATKAIKL